MRLLKTKIQHFSLLGTFWFWAGCRRASGLYQNLLLTRKLSSRGAGLPLVKDSL
jgi:hypothetical protein